MQTTLEDPSGVPIEQLCLSVQWYHALKRNGVHTIGQLAQLPEPRLLTLRISPRSTMAELKDKVGRLGLAPWDAPEGGQPGRLSSCALSVAAALLLPAAERARWVEEWKSELWALKSRKARARFIASLLLAAGRNLVRRWDGMFGGDHAGLGRLPARARASAPPAAVLGG